MAYLFDTNIWVDFLRGKDATLKKKILSIAEHDRLLCSIVKAELLYGARVSDRVEHNLATLRDLFSTMISVDFDDRAADHYGLLRAHLKRAGALIGANDMLIAATALAHDLTLVTRDVDEFQRVAGLRLATF